MKQGESPRLERGTSERGVKQGESPRLETLGGSVNEWLMSGRYGMSRSSCLASRYPPEREMALKREQRKKDQEDSVDISIKKSKAELLQEEARKALAEAKKQDAAFQKTQAGGGFFGSMMKSLSGAGRPQSRRHSTPHRTTPRAHIMRAHALPSRGRAHSRLGRWRGRRGRSSRS